VACCGTGCQTQHSNGLGQTYFDCGALGEHTRAQAELAAEAWRPSGSTIDATVLCASPCLCRATPTEAAVWCFAGGILEGFVKEIPSPICSAACPFERTLTWD
jgi:hypothetical protein